MGNRRRTNRENAQHSTGPRTQQGKQRSRLNAFKHGLSGQYLVLAEHEHEAYYKLNDRMCRDVEVKTEPERQILVKIVDINFRLNRLTSIESNMYTLDTVDHTSQRAEDDRVAVMDAQARAWKNDAHTFDVLGRYEARLSKQLLQYQKELERLIAARLSQSKPAEGTTRAMRNPAPPFVMREQPPYEDGHATLVASQPTKTTPHTPKMASFGKTVLTAAPIAIHPPKTDRKPLPPPARLRIPEPPEAVAA
jgi:hypothetical protein